MTGQRYRFDIPVCPSCGEPVGWWGTLKARADRYDCPRCGTPLKIARKARLLHVMLLYLGLLTVSKLVPGVVGYVLIAALVVLGGVLEYTTERPVLSPRRGDREAE